MNDAALYNTQKLKLQQTTTNNNNSNVLQAIAANAAKFIQVNNNKNRNNFQIDFHSFTHVASSFYARRFLKTSHSSHPCSVLTALFADCKKLKIKIACNKIAENRVRIVLH